VADFDFHINAVADPRPGSRGYFKWYWCYGPGLKKWAPSIHPWTKLRNHMLKYPGAAIHANEIASSWFHEVFGIWPGERKGKNPLGPG
jgi:hypothetical protein